jgi:hypothetical protein
MSQRPDKSNNNGFDPFAMARGVRDTMLDSWSRSAVQFVNTDVYAQMTGLMLDTYLTVTAPWRNFVLSMMTQTLAGLNMPSRTEVTTIAERMTSIETRLDDLDASVDDIKHTLKAAMKETKSNGVALVKEER